MGIRREEENGECLLIRLKSSFWSQKKNGKTECGIIVTIVIEFCALNGYIV